MIHPRPGPTHFEQIVRRPIREKRVGRSFQNDEECEMLKDSERRPPGNPDQHSDSDSDNDDDHLSPALDQNHAKNHDDDVVPESLPEMNLGEAADPTTELDSNAPTVIDPRFSDEVVRLNLNAFVIDESDLESDEELRISEEMLANMIEDISFPDNDPLTLMN